MDEDVRNFRDEVYSWVARVPRGSVTTYGDLAALVGRARAARIVGGLAHYGPTELPWHRLVNRFGGLASAFPGGKDIQQQLLVAEGLTCTNFVVDDFAQKRWRPEL